jgi:hypothetical protein
VLNKAELKALESEHRALSDVVDALRTTADQIATLPAAEIRQRLKQMDKLLRERLLPHEHRDDTETYRRIRQRAGAPDMLAGMSRTHMEIQRQAYSLSSLSRALGDDGPNKAQRTDLQRLLYGLEAITRLHFAQEEEIYRSLEND